jgi:hypothetical protein
MKRVAVLGKRRIQLAATACAARGAGVLAPSGVRYLDRGSALNRARELAAQAGVSPCREGCPFRIVDVSATHQVDQQMVNQILMRLSLAAED